MKPVRTSAKAVIIREGRLLVTVNEDPQGTFYLLPGGGQEPGETLRAALIRECEEELGAAVIPGRLLGVRDYIGAHHEFSPEDDGVHQLELMFAGALAPGAVPRTDLRSDAMQTGCAWLALAELEEKRLYPLDLRDWLARGAPALGDPYLGDIN